MALRLDTHADFISELSTAATKEAAIEGALTVGANSHCPPPPSSHHCCPGCCCRWHCCHCRCNASFADARMDLRPRMLACRGHCQSRAEAWSGLSLGVRRLQYNPCTPMPALQSIAEAWSGLSLDMGEYKGTFKLRSTEDVFACLEDHSVSLSTMKASKFFLVFEKQASSCAPAGWGVGAGQG